ncbi:MAG TPA: hypothetical protein VKV18_01005 [Chthonomonas sp.]|uniref:hypothetical protein n=1 Tax=Chthonomonas sp. TaxID=2282153 RepID=UPI002B4AD406|nr:hypothetical protein [Chthonomonas sp.]HLI47257.1 hypothetical protein [Chthonomonas sp.]
MNETNETRQRLYQRLIEGVFWSRYSEGAREVPFSRTDFEPIAKDLGIPLPKNLGDIIYSFRFRQTLPKSILDKAPPGTTWLIRGIGRGRYCFVAAPIATFLPDPNLAETRVLDATPGIVEIYSTNDEQSLLAQIRYNRLIDLFTGLTCYSLQNHLRTTLATGFQVETDEIYVGVDHRGAHFVIPVQAKSTEDSLGTVQVEQDFAIGRLARFKTCLCRPIGAQRVENNLIALMEFEENESGIRKIAEVHYRLVKPESLSHTELQKLLLSYQERPFLNRRL